MATSLPRDAATAANVAGYCLATSARRVVALKMQVDPAVTVAANQEHVEVHPRQQLLEVIDELARQVGLIVFGEVKLDGLAVQPIDPRLNRVPACGYELINYLKQLLPWVYFYVLL